MTLKAATCNKHQTQYIKNGSHKMPSIKNVKNFLFIVETTQYHERS